MMAESFESEKLQKLIDEKKSFFKKQKNETSAKFLQREIMFLEREILPVILTNTTVLHSEVLRYVTRCYDEAVQHKCNGLLVYLPVWSEYSERPIIGIANCRKPEIGDIFGEGCVEIFCNQVEIHNRDGSGVDNVECFTFDIDDHES
jgi:hypothetical protein